MGALGAAALPSSSDLPGSGRGGGGGGRGREEGGKGEGRVGRKGGGDKPQQ